MVSASYMESSDCTDADVPIEKRSISLKHPVFLVKAPCLRPGIHQLPSLFSALSSTVALQLPSPIQRSSRMERLLSATLWWLFWDSLREFCTANQGEILITVPRVMWEEDSLWHWKQSGKHFPIFKQGQLDLCLLTLSIYKWASVYRSFTIYNNIFTNSEFCLFDWTHLEPNWPIFLIVYRHVGTEGLGGIS